MTVHYRPAFVGNHPISVAFDERIGRVYTVAVAMCEGDKHAVTDR